MEPYGALTGSPVVSVHIRRRDGPSASSGSGKRQNILNAFLGRNLGMDREHLDRFQELKERLLSLRDSL